MFLIDYVKPEAAQGEVRQIYSLFPPNVPVPESVQLLSASPRYLARQMAVAGEHRQEGVFSSEMMAALRYVGASTACFGFCSTFNRNLLLSMGLSGTEVDALSADPSQVFEAKDAALIAFVARSVADPDSVGKSDVDAARAAGWTDQQIFEATAYAAQMATVGIVYRTFAEK